MPSALDDDIALIGALADAAGAVIRPQFRSRLEVEAKGDQSPVTAADRGAEAAIRQLLGEHRPADGVVGEEYGADRPEAARVWVIDPIDGTRAFIAGRPLFGTLIALLEEGRPVLGVIDQCIIGDRWLGAVGRPTTLSGQPARVRPGRALAAAHLGTTSPHAFPADDFVAFERLRAEAGDTLYGGDCHNYGLLASGHLDLVVESGLKLHDWAALVPVVEGAGGVMRDWQGQPLAKGSGGRVVAAASPALADAAVALLSA
jgi:histidinol phosphatase-like enzyme (inositol monophosphatase family)